MRSDSEILDEILKVKVISIPYLQRKYKLNLRELVDVFQGSGRFRFMG